jgi:tetratricopeptide (TPR) repeat protein
LAIENEISQAIVVKLAPGSTVQGRLLRPTSDAQAYDLFLRGQYAMAKQAKDGLMRAERLFQEAVARDPEFGAAWAALAETVIPLHEIHNVRDEEQAYAIATDAARRALAAPSSVADGHAALAHILYHQYRWAAAEDEAKLAIAGKPGSPRGYAWLAWTLQATGRLSEAQRAYRRAVDLDPLGPYRYGLALNLLLAGHPAEAIPLAKRAVESGVSIAAVPGVLANVQLRRFEAAQNILDHMPVGTSANLIDGLRAYLLAASGRQEPARQLLYALVKRMPQGNEPNPMVVPFAYLALKEPDLALEWVSKSRQSGEFLGEFRLMPEIRALGGNGKLRELLRSVGLSEL